MGPGMGQSAGSSSSRRHSTVQQETMQTAVTNVPPPPWRMHLMLFREPRWPNPIWWQPRLGNLVDWHEGWACRLYWEISSSNRNGMKYDGYFICVIFGRIRTAGSASGRGIKSASFSRGTDTGTRAMATSWSASHAYTSNACRTTNVIGTGPTASRTTTTDITSGSSICRGITHADTISAPTLAALSTSGSPSNSTRCATLSETSYPKPRSTRCQSTSVGISTAI